MRSAVSALVIEVGGFEIVEEFFEFVDVGVVRTRGLRAGFLEDDAVGDVDRRLGAQR